MKLVKALGGYTSTSQVVINPVPVVNPYASELHSDLETGGSKYSSLLLLFLFLCKSRKLVFLPCFLITDAFFFAASLQFLGNFALVKMGFVSLGGFLVCHRFQILEGIGDE